MVGTTLEARESPQDLQARLSKLVIVSRVEGPGHTPVHQGLNRLGLQQADLQAEPGGRHIVSLWTEQFVACPRESEPSLDVYRKVSVFVDNATEV